MGKKFKDLGNVVKNKHIETIATPKATLDTHEVHEVQDDKNTRHARDVQDVQDVCTQHVHDAEQAQDVQDVQHVQEIPFSVKQSSLTLGSTQGIKGKRLPRINMAFSSETYEYIKRESRIRGLSATAFVNYIIEEYKKEPGHINYRS